MPGGDTGGSPGCWVGNWIVEETEGQVCLQEEAEIQSCTADGGIFGRISLTPGPSPSTSPLSQGAPFPAGSYTFTTFLRNISTNCTSNSAFWKCDPYVTYGSDPINSRAQFHWIITAANTTPTASSDFKISSTNNPFAIKFMDISLVLMHKGTDMERYSFKTQAQKIVYPTGSLATKCFYNLTQFIGNLYTKKRKTLPLGTVASPSNTSSATPTGNSELSAEWEFAVDATQSTGGGANVPDCYQYNEDGIGDNVTFDYEEQGSNDVCSCVYDNYDG
ncbi:MAG: hypothetical protein Q9163_001363 [Psora crenata]